MRIDEIDELIVSKEDFDDISGIDYKKIKSKINNGELNPDESDLVEKAKKLFGDDFFNLSESGRTARMDYVKKQNAKLSEIKTNIESLATEIKNLEEKKSRGETTVDGKNIQETIDNKKNELKKTRNSVSDLEKGAKTSDILKQTLSKWNYGWNFYKKGVEERYDHPYKYAFKRIPLPALTLLFGGMVLDVSACVIAYFAARIYIAQKRKKAGYKPNLDALKANFFTGKNSLKNALFRKKNVEKIIGKVKGIDLEKVIGKASSAPTKPAKDEEDTKTSSKSISLDKLIEQINSIKLEDKKYENIENMRLLLKELEVRIGMGAIIPEDDKLKKRIQQMRNIVKTYDTLMEELNKAYSKKDDNSLENMKYLYNTSKSINAEYPTSDSLTPENANKKSILVNIIERFKTNVAKKFHDAYEMSITKSEDDMEKLIKFCEKIDDYEMFIDDEKDKKKILEIKKIVAEYKKNNVDDNTVSKLDELFDNLKEEEINNMPLEDIKGIIDRVDSVKDKLSKDSQAKYAKILERKNILENPKKDEDSKAKDEKRILFEENRKVLRNPSVDDISIASIPKENINHLRSFVDSIRPYENELNDIERKNYDRLVNMLKKWDKINTNREFLRNCNDTELNNLPNETLNWISKRIAELDEIKSDLTTDEVKKMNVISSAISGYLDKRKLFIACRDSWKNISAYSTFKIEKKEQYDRICEIVDAVKQFENELSAEERIKLNKYIEARDNYALVKKCNHDLNDLVKKIDVEQLKLVAGLNKNARNQAFNNMIHGTVNGIQREIKRVEALSMILEELNRKNLLSNVSINDMEKLKEIINLKVTNIKKANISNLESLNKGKK